MPKIVVSSIHNYIEKENELIQPILGMVSDIKASFEKCYVSSKEELYERIGSEGLDSEGLLLDQGFGLKIAPKSICSPHYKTLRLLTNGSYCYPSLDGDNQYNFPSEIINNYNFESLMTSNKTVAMKFPIKDFKDSDYILLSVGSYFILLYWGRLVVSPILAELRYQVESLEGLIEFLEVKCGFKVQNYGSYLVLSKLQEFSTSYFTNIEEFEITSDENGCSDIMSLCVPPILDIKTKNTRYQNDIKVSITKSIIDKTYNLSILVKDKVLESHSLRLTKECESDINIQSKMIDIIIHKPNYEQNISGEYYLRREFRGEVIENDITPKTFFGYPYVSALITKDFTSVEGLSTEPNLLGFDSNSSIPWSTNIVKHYGSCKYKGIDISSELLFLIRLREGSLLGEETNISEVVPKGESGYNGIELDYSYNVLSWIYHDSNRVVSVIPTLTLQIIHTALSNNLQGLQLITEEIISKILSSYQRWLTSLQSYRIISIERIDQIQRVNVEVTTNGFNGITDISQINIEIRS